MHNIQIEDEEGVLEFLHGRQQNWKFSQFYFLSSDERGFTPEGTVEQFEMESASDALFHKQERTMFMETLSSGQAVTLFAIPIERGDYRGFDYDAIAVSYSNADIVASLDVNAFSDQSMCLVVNTDGSVLLSTQQSGSAFGNYLSYLNAGSDLGPERLAEVRQDWENGVSGVVRCGIGGISHYISYQPVGYEECILLGVVPESAASDSMLKMVTEAQGSISLHGRASTANPKIIGYSQQEMGAAVQKLFQGEVDAAGCVSLMDEYRISAARELGTEGF